MGTTNSNTPVVLVNASEQEKVVRAVRTWLNTYTNKPLSKVDYEYLGDTSGLSLSTEQASFKVRQYITGGYQAQYQFKILYRTIAENTDERLAIDEALNKYGEWCEQNPLTLGTGMVVNQVKRTTNAGISARFDDGVEDHQISLTLTYEVI